MAVVGDSEVEAVGSAAEVGLLWVAEVTKASQSVVVSCLFALALIGSHC